MFLLLDLVLVNLLQVSFFHKALFCFLKQLLYLYQTLMLFLYLLFFLVFDLFFSRSLLRWSRIGVKSKSERDEDWYCSGRTFLNSNRKFFLAPNSKFKGMSDYKKYEKARKLKNMVVKIREDYNKKFTDESTENRQLATATYLIDRLALRVGNEKGEDEADTVGCCTLRVEHVKIEEDNYITFDFLAKDSMRYFNRIQIDEKAHKNLARFAVPTAKTI